MDRGQNRTFVAIGSVAAILLLLGAFLLVWLVPRGSGVGNANVGGQSGSGSTSNIGAKSVDNAPASTNFSPSGAPSMAQISDQPNISVRGTGIVSAKPDLINLQVGVQIQKTALSD